MTTKLTIVLIGLMAVVLIFMGSVTGETIKPSTVDEQTGQAKEFATFECDPCDYNIDYGKAYDDIEQDSVQEGLVKVECDPCDYNIDYGKTHPAEK